MSDNPAWKGSRIRGAAAACLLLFAAGTGCRTTPAAASAGPAGELEVEAQGPDGERRLKLRLQLTEPAGEGRGPRLERATLTLATVAGAGSRQADLALSLSAASPSPRLSQCAAISWLADGLSLAASTPQYTARTSASGEVVEELQATQSVERLRAAAKASRLSLQLCGRELPIAPAQQAAIGALLKESGPARR